MCNSYLRAFFICDTNSERMFIQIFGIVERTYANEDLNTSRVWMEKRDKEKGYSKSMILEKLISLYLPPDIAAAVGQLFFKVFHKKSIILNSSARI